MSSLTCLSMNCFSRFPSSVMEQIAVSTSCGKVGVLFLSISMFDSNFFFRSFQFSFYVNLKHILLIPTTYVRYVIERRTFCKLGFRIANFEKWIINYVVYNVSLLSCWFLHQSDMCVTLPTLIFGVQLYSYDKKVVHTVNRATCLWLWHKSRRF